MSDRVQACPICFCLLLDRFVAQHIEWHESDMDAVVDLLRSPVEQATQAPGELR